MTAPDRTVVLVRHGSEERDDDLAARFLAANGWRLRSVYTVQGDSLPDPADPALQASIVYGGLESANDAHRGSSIPGELAWIERWLATGKPYFGICLGGQMLARVLGARVAPHAGGVHEVGYHEVLPAPDAGDFLPPRSRFYQWHQEGFELPPGCRRLACGEVYPEQAFVYGDNAYAVQFHPEVTGSMLRRWLESSGHALPGFPSVHAVERQLRDNQRFGPVIEHWLHRFLAVWVGDIPQSGEKSSHRLWSGSLAR